MDLELLRERSRIIREARRFFDRRSYLEVDTPLLAPHLIPESCLEVFETAYLKPPPAGPASPGPARPYWLIPSPELWMKRLIARHNLNVYQIGKCFRNGESTGRFHSPEFTMLEYYTMDAGYLDSLSLTEELFCHLGQGRFTPFLRISMEEAFAQWAGIDLFPAAAEGGLGPAARRLGMDLPPLSTAELFNLIFIHAVEPKLPADRPVALLDYPAFVPCLARKRPDGKTVERWELYSRGVELANCYSEETDPQEVRRFFEAETRIKERRALVPHRVDREYWRVFLPGPSGRPFPPCSGVALGLDRLIMILLGQTHIDGVLPFPMEAL